MADRYWVGANGTSVAATAYATTASWSATKDGPNGASIPSAAVPDIVRFDNSTAGSKFVNVNQSIGNIPNIYFVGSGLNWTLCGSTSAIAGTAWTLTAPVTIDVGPGVNTDAQFNNNITASGAAKIIKTGLGSLSNYTISTTTWGACPIDLQAGTILFYFTTDKLGTGKITQSGGTYLAVASSLAATLNNPIDVIGDVVWNYEPNLPASVARGLMTLKATVDFGSVTRTVQVGATGNTNSTTISGAITGSAGFTKAGPGTLTLQNTGNSFTGPSNPLSITGTGGLLFDGSLTTPVATTTLSGITSISVASSNYYAIAATGNSFSVTAPISGAGLVAVASVATTIGPTFAAGSLSGLTGTTIPTGSGSTVSVAAGFYVYGEGGTANRKASYATVNDFPSTGNTTWMMEASSASCAAVIKYAGAGGTFTGPLYALLRTNTNIATATTALYANGSGALVLTGAFKRDGTTGNFVFTLGGTSASNVNNTLSGNITETGGVFAISKSDANKWVLSGANSYTGLTTISAGTLSAQSAQAFGSPTTGAVTLAATGVLEVSGGINLTKTSVAINLQGGTVRNGTGDNTVTASTAPLTVAATTFDVPTGSLTWKPTISSAAVLGISKTGAQLLKLDNIANTFTGATTITGGTLEAIKLAVVSASSSIGAPALANATITLAPTCTLKLTGTTADTTDRIIALSSAGVLTIDSSGSSAGALSLTTTNSGAFSLPNGANTLVFTGTNTAGNTCSRTIANPVTGTTALSKTGSNTWTFTGTLSHTGATSCSAGELNLGGSARTLSSALQLSATGLIANGTAPVEAPSVTLTGGTLTASLTGTGTLTVDSGVVARIAPNAAATGSNAQIGAIAVTAGAVVELVTPDAVDVSTAGNGRVLGNGATTVAGTIRTKTSATSAQKGQARYKSLTLTSGSRIEVGAAA